MKMRVLKRLKYRRRPRIWDLTFTFTEVQVPNVRLFHSSWLHALRNELPESPGPELPVPLLRGHLMEIQGMTITKGPATSASAPWDCSTDDHDLKFIPGDSSVGEGDYVECRYCDYSRAATEDEIAGSYADPEDY